MGIAFRARRRRWAAPALAALLALGGCGQRGGDDATGHAGSWQRFFEIYEPAGRPRGTMLLLHGGGWRDRPGDARRGMAGAALVYRAQGWRVVNLAYREAAGVGSSRPDPAPMFDDVAAAYDDIRKAFPGPVCASGASAGGHLAAMLAVLRPTLDCVVSVGGPLDLRTLPSQTSVEGRAFVAGTFGDDPATLSRWSPARRWAAGIGTRVLAGAATGDPIVPPAQLRRFAAADRSATTIVLPPARVGDAGAATFAHSLVPAAAKARFQERQAAFLDRVAPPTRTSAPTAPAAPGAQAACDSVLPGDGRPWRPLQAGGGWTLRSDPRVPLAATAGCSGTAARQDAGLSVWAFPATGLVVPAGSEASITHDAADSAPLRWLEASLRGFVGRPRQWQIGLFAGTGGATAPTTPVAACIRGVCTGLRLVPGARGALLSTGAGDPDAQDAPSTRRFALPTGTRTVAWRIRCVAPKGCSLDGIGPRTRPRDPLGHPVILSVYELRWG